MSPKRPIETGDLIFSSEHGRMCPSCGRPAAKCDCKPGKAKGKHKQRDKHAPAGPSVPDDGVVRVHRETKGRKGKGMTLVTGVPLDDKDLAKLAKQLKRKCGTGGTVKDGVIEIQGDHRDTLIDALTKLGFNAKLAGG